MAPDTAGGGIAAPQAVDLVALRAWRLGRLCQELKARDYAGALLYDPINIRYACDARNMQVRSEGHTSELQSLMRIPYAVFCLRTETQEPTAQLVHRQQ